MDFDTWLKSAGHDQFSQKMQDKLNAFGIAAFVKLSDKNQKLLKKRYKKFKYKQNKFK